MIFDKLAMERRDQRSRSAWCLVLSARRKEMNCGIVVGEGRNNHYAIDKNIRKACEQSGDD